MQSAHCCHCLRQSLKVLTPVLLRCWLHHHSLSACQQRSKATSVNPPTPSHRPPAPLNAQRTGNITAPLYTGASLTAMAAQHNAVMCIKTTCTLDVDAAHRQSRPPRSVSAVQLQRQLPYRSSLQTTSAKLSAISLQKAHVYTSCECSQSDRKVSIKVDCRARQLLLRVTYD